MAQNKSLKKAGAGLKQYGMMIMLIVVYLLFAIITKGKNLTPMNINNLIMQNGYVVILAVGMLLCVLTGLFPNLVTTYITEPAARAVFSVAQYISAMGFDASGVAAESAVSFAHVGVWEPISWLLILCIALLSVTIVAVASKYDNVSQRSGDAVDSKYELFYGGEAQEFSQVGGGDLFWGFKHNWRGYFDVMHRLHSGVVNDYALWTVVDAALIMGFMLIVL